MEWKYDLNSMTTTDCISLYLVDCASFSNSFYFFTNLIHLVFFYNPWLFVSACFGPIGPSSGGSNAQLHKKQLLASFPQSLICRGTE